MKNTAFTTGGARFVVQRAVDEAPGSNSKRLQVSLEWPRTKAVFPCPFKALSKNVRSVPSLHGEGVNEIQRTPLKRVRLGRHGKGQGIVHTRERGGIAGRTAGVAHDGGKPRKECREAVDGCAILVASMRELGFRRGRAPGRGRRITGGPGGLVFIGEEQLPSGVFQVPPT